MRFKFLGYPDNGKTPYYGDGEFTVGKTYTTDRLDYEDNPQLHTEGEFIDDTGGMVTEEIQYFKPLGES